MSDIQEELSRVLADWNALVKAIGSPTQGGAIAHAKQLRTDHDHPMTRNALMAKYGPNIASALLDATERIADLEGALRQICELTEDYKHDEQLSEVWYIADDTLTPEGGVS